MNPAAAADPILRALRLERDRVTDWARHPFDIPALRTMDTWTLDPRVTFLTGENGSGKSTLVEALALKIGLNPEGGSKNFRRRDRPSESDLAEYCTLVRGVRRETSSFFLRAETMFNVITEAEREGYGEYGWTELHEKSHGEAFLWVALERFRDGGLYLLDEPESALSPQRQLAFLARLHQLVRTGAQFVIATHSPILLAYPEASIHEIDGEGIHRVAYEDVRTVNLTRAVLQDPLALMARLIRDVEEDEDEPELD